MIKATNEHPFWVEGKEWVKAGDLLVGETFVTADGHSVTLLETTFEAHPKGITIYNLTVDADYLLVSAASGNDAVWVQNEGRDKPTIAMSEREPKSSLSTADILRLLREQPGYMTKHAGKERQRDEHMAKISRLSAPILAELRKVGLDYATIDDLRRSATPYPQAIPVLLQWLPVTDDRDVKESIIRALTVPWARPMAARPLIAEFHRLPDTESSVKWAIGNALEVVANESVLDELEQIAKDRRHGTSRQMVVLALANMRQRVHVATLLELLSDDQVALHAVIALGKLRATEACTQLEELADHGNPLFQKEVAKALRRIKGK